MDTSILHWSSLTEGFDLQKGLRAWLVMGCLLHGVEACAVRAQSTSGTSTGCARTAAAWPRSSSSFLTEQELKQHCAREHGGAMTRAEKRQALTIPINLQVRPWRFGQQHDMAFTVLPQGACIREDCYMALLQSLAYSLHEHPCG